MTVARPARQASGSARREKNPFHSVKIGQGEKEQVIGVSGPQFSLLAMAAGGGCKVTKNVNEKEFGVLHRMGLIRFHFGQEKDWPVPMAMLTPAGAQALAQEPFGHASTAVQ
jgi:hypothetical protein